MMKDLFRRFSQKTSEIMDSPGSFISALLLLLIWAFTGLIFGISDTWQLVINTTTTIITFLMVFRILNTQNRDAKAIHLKPNELISRCMGPGIHSLTSKNYQMKKLSNSKNSSSGSVNIIQN